MGNRLDTPLSRRRVLNAGLAAGTLACLPIWSGHAQAACAHLRAGITGYNVINTLDPGKASLIPEFYVIWGVFNTLVKFNERMEIVPDLAESWTAKSPTLWAFKLRPGVLFHDGKPLTAEDVKFTIERLKDEAFGSPHKSKFDVVSTVRVIDELSFEIETAKPFAPLLSYLTNTRSGSQIVPKHILENGSAEDFAKKPIGSGPFRLTAFNPGASLSLEAFGDYFVEGQPMVGSIDMPLIAEESAGVTALLGGSIDVASTAPFADVPELMSDPKVTVLRSPGVNTRFVSLNTSRAPFDDVHFRRALSMAFDRQAMVEVVLFGEGRVANGVIPSAIDWAYRSEPHPLLRFDPEAARAELAKSKHGEGTEATVLTWGAGWWKRFAEVFVLQVNRTLGLNFKVEVSEAGTVYQRKQAGDFEATIWGWLGLIDPDEYAYDILHSKGWRNFEKYANAEVDALLEQARSELDQAKRGDLYRKAELLAIEDSPVIFCFESNVHNLLRPSVKGFEQLPYSAFGAQFAAVTDC